MSFSFLKTIRILAVSIFVTHSVHAEPPDFAAWWISNYGVLTAKEDSRVKRAEQVFERVSNAADKKGNRLPGLIVIKASGDPYAEAIQDGTVVLTQGALNICYQAVSTEVGDARLAFVLGHELAHLAKDDFWHGVAFMNSRKYQQNRSTATSIEKLFFETTEITPETAKKKEEIKVKELQADSYGVLYMTMAGYDPRVLLAPDGKEFLKYWAEQITGQVAYTDQTHGSPSERISFVEGQMQAVVDELEFFSFGVRLYELGRHSDAIQMLGKFVQSFFSREVLNNIGLCYFERAMQSLENCDLALATSFRFATAIDNETFAARFKTRGSSTLDQSPCLKEDPFRSYVAAAIRYLEQAVEKDHTHVSSRLNLSSTQIVSGEYSKALGTLDDGLNFDPNHPGLLNNKGIALFLFGNANNIETSGEAARILEKADVPGIFRRDVLYNLSAINRLLGRSSAADGFHKRFEREEISLIDKNRPPGVSRVSVTPKSPVPLGSREHAKTSLAGFVRKDFSIGSLNGSIYTKDDTRVLVLGSSVELVETKTANVSGILRTEGKPLQAFHHKTGSTFIYSNWGIDTGSGDSGKIFFFKSN